VVSCFMKGQKIMATKKITINTVKDMKPGETIWDSELKGFGCRHRQKVRVFLVKYRDGKGRTARQYLYTIGQCGSPWTPDTARAEAKKVLGRVANKENPAADRQQEKKAKNISEAFKKYLEDVEAKRRPQTYKSYKRLYEKIIEKELGSYRIDAVARADIARLHDSLRDTPYQANRMLAVLSAFFSWCEKHGHRTEGNHPCRYIEKYREMPRERFLSEAEIYNLGEALKQYEEDHRLLKTTKKDKTQKDEIENTVTPYVTAAIRLLLLTGARCNEILTLRWEDIIFERKLIRLQESKTGQKTIYLSAPALQLLTEIPRIENNPYVICGKKEGAHLVNIKDPWSEIRKNAGLEDVRLHDLRHNYASTAVASGHHLKVIGSLLGHADTKTTERYAHLANDPLQTANEAISKKILDAMTTKPNTDNVTKIHR